MFIIDYKEFANAKNTEMQKEHRTLRTTITEYLCSTTMRGWTDVIKHMSLAVLSVLFVLEIMAAKTTNDRSPMMVQRKKESITCFVQAYNPIRPNSFEATTSKLLEIPFKDILTHVNLEISDKAETLLINQEEHAEVKKSVAIMFEPRRPSRSTVASEFPSSTAHQVCAVNDDGRVVVEVEPEKQTEGGLRRSTRKRNAFVYDS